MRHLILPALLLAATPAAAQRATPPDSAQIQRAREAGAYLVHWVQKSSSTEQKLQFQNVASIPIEVVSWEIYDCNNIGGNACGTHEGGPVIMPGQTAEIVVIHSRDRRAPWNYQYRFRVRWQEPAPPQG